LYFDNCFVLLVNVIKKSEKSKLNTENKNSVR
jgi:hypothetical protein